MIARHQFDEIGLLGARGINLERQRWIEREWFGLGGIFYGLRGRIANGGAGRLRRHRIRGIVTDAFLHNHAGHPRHVRGHVLHDHAIAADEQ